MKLNTLDIEAIAADKELAAFVQSILINLKLLSGTADGKVGAQTRCAIAELLQITKSQVLTPELLQLKSLPQPKLDLSKGDFAARIAKYMLAQNYWIDERHNNIVYAEGCNSDGKPNADTMNEWNDLRLILRVENGIPKISNCWNATTEPGLKYTINPLNPGGAFRVALSQYKAWSVGWHKTHEALVQVGEIKGYRDRNKDGFRTGDTVVIGSDFGVNQHWGYDMPQVDGASAGCLVGQSTRGHLEFMKIIKSDPRYQANNNYVFLTTIMDGSKL
ncbi:MAG: peptidoglycan-binding protein [Tolypothrix brevis GSE-NOS-MK-07-07A]|jgi:peptidoglycan hydrolase-like protein with peptidoglycan-binding domain|nr:peptidoglycan-binding protein [Tolypothrix brevis GSE-NOS-MK-07-07A]